MRLRPSALLLALALLLGPSACGGGAARSGAPAGKPGVRLGVGVRVLEVEGGELIVSVRDEGGPLSDEAIDGWVRRSAGMVVDYCGRFPVPELRVEVVNGGRGSLGWGQHWDGRRIRVHAGDHTTEAELRRDWVMVHEMLHSAFPDLPRRHRWMQEGLSTYLESVLRVRAGVIGEDEVWSRFMRSMEHGRPRFGDRGLDRTPTWGRVYWGGALFWFVVDVTLRERSHGETTLQDLIRGILAEGGDGRADWSTRRVVRVSDRVTGTTVLSELYARLAEQPGDVNTEALYRDLGVSRGAGGRIVYDDQAPLAYVRRALFR